MKSNKIDIKEIFNGLQKEMEVKLNQNKKTITHSVTKGDVGELEWLKMLKDYLPERYSVEKAQVIDYEGSLSDQIDIVIFDRHYSPFILKQNGVKYVPAESVYAVIEVKPIINLKNIKYASDKAESVRKLKRTNAKIVQASGTIRAPKNLPNILSGILAIKGTYNENIFSLLKNYSDLKCVNFGCSLDGVYFRIKNFKIRNKNSIPHELEHHKDENGFVIFIINLLSELQKMGTVPAVEFEKYINNIKE